MYGRKINNPSRILSTNLFKNTLQGAGANNLICHYSESSCPLISGPRVRVPGSAPQKPGFAAWLFCCVFHFLWWKNQRVNCSSQSHNLLAAWAGTKHFCACIIRAGSVLFTSCSTAAAKFCSGSGTNRLMPCEEKKAALCVSQPGMGEMWINGTPQTAASVEESPPGFVMNRSQAFRYSAMRDVYPIGSICLWP